MQAGLSPARQARAQHRHELRTLTYVTLDQANGGIVRNLTHEGIAVQAVAAVRPQQQLRVRFELRHPRLRVETLGEVMWATASGQCGIRFVELSPGMAGQINEWIFGSMLEGIPPHYETALTEAGIAGPGFTESKLAAVPAVEEDGLMVAATPLKVIELPMRLQMPESTPVRIREGPDESFHEATPELDWLSQPLSGRSLVWTVNTLVVVAALLLFVLVFLSVTREPPKWPVAMVFGAAALVTALYWGFFKAFGGASLGARLASLVGSDSEEDAEARFR